MTSTTNGHARCIVLLSTAILLATTLAGCTPVANGLFNEKRAAVEKTATPTPTPTAVPLGGVLTKDAALTLRQDMAANGDFAYAMPDGTWVKTNRSRTPTGAAEGFLPSSPRGPRDVTGSVLRHDYGAIIPVGCGVTCIGRSARKLPAALTRPYSLGRPHRCRPCRA